MRITIENITKSFDKKNKVLNNLSITIEEEKLTTLLGSSGCGKTTLLRIISGLEKPEQGRIIFDDNVVFDSEKKINLSPIKRCVAFVFQDFALWPNMTVLKNVEFGIRSIYHSQKSNLLSKIIDSRNEIKRQAMEALKMVKMDEYANRLPSELSGGQKQRVAIARAIAVKPKVILFDEPLSALDAILREEMREEIKELVSNLKMTAIFVTHDQDEAMSISDSIIIMNKGTIIETNNPSDIYWKPKSKFTAEFIGKSTWLSNTEFLRPEDISLIAKKGLIKKKVKVCSIQSKGGTFEVRASLDGIEYFFKSDLHYEINDEVNIYYAESSIRKVEL